MSFDPTLLKILFILLLLLIIIIFYGAYTTWQEDKKL